jgi:hypothetical protein
LQRLVTTYLGTYCKVSDCDEYMPELGEDVHIKVLGRAQDAGRAGIIPDDQ